MFKKYRFYLIWTVAMILAATVIFSIDSWTADSFWVSYNQGNFYYDQEQFDEAIAEYTKAIEMAPEFVEAYNNRGNAHGRKGDYDKAISDYTKAIEINPRFGKGYVNLGYAFYLKNEYGLACFYYKKACMLGYCKGLSWVQSNGLCDKDPLDKVSHLSGMIGFISA